MLENTRIRPTWLGSPDLLSASLPPAPQVLKYRGEWNAEARQNDEVAHGDGELDRLHLAGVRMLWIDFYSGFGLEFEKLDLERSRAFISVAHAKGFKIAARIQFGAMTPETLLLEENECQNWLQLNQNGHHPAIGSDAFFRVRPCYNSEGFMRYMERICGLAVEFGADLIHFEHLGYNAEPDTCRCAVCVASFREFLRQRYGNQDDRTRNAGKERWGHHSFTHVRPPVYPQSFGADGVPEKSPHHQDWNAFKIGALSAALGRLSRGAHKRSPECAVGCDAFRLESFAGKPDRCLLYDHLLPWLDVVDAGSDPRPIADELVTLAGAAGVATPYRDESCEAVPNAFKLKI